MDSVLYDRLGLNASCSFEEIKISYRQLARKYHPDKNPNNPEAADKFKDISEAYECLSNPEKRSKYDRFGMESLKSTPGQHVDPRDIFSQLFSNRRSVKTEIPVNCTLEELYCGIEK